MKRLYLIFIFLIILLVYFSIPNLYCQQKSLKFEYITTNEGLSQSTVNCILQDSKGFLWFGTRYGLNKYDGYNIITYFNNPKDSSSVAGDIIQSLYEDSRGNLWIGTNNGLSLYNRDLDNFINYNSRNNFEGTLIGDICEDRQGRFWIGTIGKGLFLFDYKSNTFINYTHLDDNPNSLSSNEIRALEVDVEGNLWIGTEGGGLNMFNYDSSALKRFYYKEDQNNQSENSIWSITKDHNETIWIGTLGNGLYKLNIEPGGNYSFTNYKPETGDNRRLKILSLFPENNGGIWIGTENGGLDYFDRDKETFKNYKYDEYSSNCLNNNSIQSIYIDDCGNLLVGTYTGGVNLVKKNKKKIGLYSKIPGNPNSLSYNAVSCFYEDGNKNLWIGTDGGGLNILNRQTGQITHYTSKNSNFNSDAVLSIASCDNKNILIGGWELGLIIYNSKNKSFKYYTQKNSNIPNNNIFDIMCDKKGRIWITFGGLGFARYDIDKNEYKEYFSTNIDLPSKWVLELSEDSYGNILLGSSEGLIMFNSADESITTFAHNSEDKSSLSHNEVNSILESSDSVLWVGTNYGLNQYIRNTKSFVHYFEEDGLINNKISGLVEDDKGYIWISTANGISKFDPRLKTFKNYSLSDGLQGKDFIRRSCYKTESGEVLFGGTNGFNIFHPDSLHDNSFIPPVVLTNFYLFYKEVLIGGEDGVLQKHISETDQITLSYKYSTFSFQYAALDYTSPEKNQYAYMLEGFEKDWNYVGNRRMATFTNLDPGKYIFRVKASNNDGIWNEEGTFIKIIILTPWWKTLLFRISLAVFLLAGSVTFYRVRLNKLRKEQQKLARKIKERTIELSDANALLEERKEEITMQNEELSRHRNHLEQLVKERTIELEAAKKKAEESDRLKSAFLANMSHEIRTPMNAIVGFSTLISEGDITNNERKGYADIIKDNSDTLLVLINDIIEISLIEANQLRIIKSNFDATSILLQLKNYFSMKNNKGIEFQYTNEKDDARLILHNDPTRFRQVFSNLLNNAFKYTESGNIWFGYEIQDDQVQFFVSDTGIGIASSDFKNIFNYFHKLEKGDSKIYPGAGIGLSLSSKLIELMGGKIWLESEEGEGSTFYFTIPYSPDNIAVSPKGEKEKRSMYKLEKMKILVAEDEPNNYQLIEKILQPTGAEIIWARNGREAVDFVSKHPGIRNCLVLMDIKMPVMNGIEANEEIKKINRDIPIIAVTAYAYAQDKTEIMQHDFKDYIVKPLKPQRLIESIKKFI